MPASEAANERSARDTADQQQAAKRLLFPPDKGAHEVIAWIRR
jgi:hypothetical protein